MRQSETIGKLAEALSKAQGEIEGARMDSSNPFFKSKYADLTSVWEACRKPLTKHGLSIIQSPGYICESPEYISLTTRMCHISGEWVEDVIAMKPVKPDPQSVGSLITYMRRYSLQSFVGVAPEDDDGNAASGQGAKPTPPKPKESVPQVITPAQRTRLFAIAKEHACPNEAIKEYLKDTYGVTSSNDIPIDKYEAIVSWVQSSKEAPNE